MDYFADSSGPLSERGEISELTRKGNAATIEQQIEAAGFGTFQYTAILAFILFIIADGMELVVTNVIWGVLPREEWGMEEAWRAYLVSASFFGFVGGAAIGGIVGDNYGRRPLLYVHSILFIPASIVAGVAWNGAVLLITRVMVGISIGLVLPTCVSMMSEMTPPSHRGRSSIVIPGIAYCSGQVLVLLLAVFLISTYGYECADCQWWRWLLVLGIVPDAIGITLVHLFLPESPRFLLVQGRDAELAAALQRISSANGTRDKLIDDGRCRPLGTDEQYKDIWQSTTELFEEPLVHVIPLSVITWCLLSIGMFAQVFMWPIEIEATGYDHVTQVWLMIFVALIEIPGILTVVLVIDMPDPNDPSLLLISRKKLVIGLALISGSWIIVHIFLRSLGPAWMVFGNFGMRLFSVCPYKVMYVYMAELIPTSHRNVGLSFGNGATKTAAAILPLIIVPLWTWNSLAPFMFVAFCAFLGALLMFLATDVDGDLPDSTVQFRARSIVNSPMTPRFNSYLDGRGLSPIARSRSPVARNRNKDYGSISRNYVPPPEGSAPAATSGLC